MTCCLLGPNASIRAQSATQEQQHSLRESPKDSHLCKRSYLPIMMSMAISSTNTLALPLQILSEKVDVLRLTFYTAPVSCGALVPVFFLREVGSQLPTV